MSTQSVTFGGNPVTLLGTAVKPGDKAPDATLLNDGLEEVKLSDYKGKVKLLSIFPSIDTSVCSVQTRKFNKEAGAFGNKVAFLSVSADLPFALKRFCGAEGIDNLTSLSDHRNIELGDKYGLHVKELRLLARAVVIIDSTGTVKYVEVVPEIGNEPNYEAAIDALNGLL